MCQLAQGNAEQGLGCNLAGYYQSQSGTVDSPHEASAVLPSQLVQAPQSVFQAAGPQTGQQETSLLSEALVAPTAQTGTLPNWRSKTACPKGKGKGKGSSSYGVAYIL